MDRDQEHDIDLDDLGIEIPDLDVGIGDDGGSTPPPGTGGGGGGGGGLPQGDPFFSSRWAAWVPAGLIALFGLQSLLVLYVSRMGLGSEGMAWALALLFVASFTVVFIAGARFIARHRH